MTETVAKIGLALPGPAQQQLARALYAAGYEVYIAANAAQVPGERVDAWIFDARWEEMLEVLLATGQFILPAENPPDPEDLREFANWSDGLVRQIDDALASQAAAVRPRDQGGNWSQVKAVWLLAGSAGATSAVQQFLNGFSQPPPIAFIYAQHYAPEKQDQLEQYTLQNKAFSLIVGEGVHSLAPGRIVMIPPRCQVSIGDFGRIASTRTDWGSHHTPDINELLYIFTGAGLPCPGVIVFSGMGDDGAAALKVFDAAGGRIWAQSPDSSVCPGMPQAAINTGRVHRTGTPGQLAAALELLHSPGTDS